MAWSSRPKRESAAARAANEARRTRLAMSSLGQFPRWLEIVRAEAARRGATIYDVMSGSRLAHHARARHAAWMIIYDTFPLDPLEGGASYSEIARVWGVDHTTVMQAVRKRRAVLERIYKGSSRPPPEAA